MAEKPDLSAASGVQNVVVYVSSDNFAQAYAVAGHTGGDSSIFQHSVAPLAIRQTKARPGEYSTDHQAARDYFTGVISQNGIPQPLANNVGYQNGASRPVNCDGYAQDATGYVTVVGAEPGPQHSVRCDSVRSVSAESSCSSLSSADEAAVVAVQNQVVDDSSVSVRPPVGHQAALAQAPSVILTVGPSAAGLQQQNSSFVPGTLNIGQSRQIFVTIPYGWKRLLNNGTIVYISPSNTALSSPEQVKQYLLAPGTCKCGLECHFKYDNVFNFDHKVAGKPWVLSPDTNTGDLTKLCNHKRKIIAMASLECKLPDPNSIELRKEYSVKRKKRKIGLPYTGGVSVSQILAHREKLALNHHNLNKDVVGNQVWPHSPVNNNPQVISNRLQVYQKGNQNHHLVRCPDPTGSRIMAGSPVVLGDASMAVLPQQNSNGGISHQQPIHQMQVNPGPVNIQSQSIIRPGRQIVNIQGPINPNNNPAPNQLQQPDHSTMVFHGQNAVQSPQQHRIFINGQPNEPSGPGRPNIQMIPVSISSQQSAMSAQPRPDMHQRILQQHHNQQQQQVQFYNAQQQHHPQYQIQQYDPSRNARPFGQVVNNMRPQGMPNHMLPFPGQQLQQQQQHKMQWQNRVQNFNQEQPNQIQINQASSQGNIYERVPPLHQHQPQPTIWQEELKKKKVKLGAKAVKNRPYQMLEACQSHPPCPNVDVRQIPNENRAIIINNQGASNPSFLEDPSGYLAQQTALLNSTINRQTGADGCPNYICNSPATSVSNLHQHYNIVAASNQQMGEVPLPSNMVLQSHAKPQGQILNRPNQNINVIKNAAMPQPSYNQMPIQQPQIADSSLVPDQQNFAHCQGCVAEGQFVRDSNQTQRLHVHSRPSSTPGTPSSSVTSEDPVSSSTYSYKHSSQASPDSRPIQGGTVSTSNVSPMDGTQSDPPTPHPHTPTPPQRPDTSQPVNTGLHFVYSQSGQMQQLPQQIAQSREANHNYHNQNHNLIMDSCCSHGHVSRMQGSYSSAVVTTMASGRTSGSNTLTSVLAGRTNTATVSINSPSSVVGSSTPNSMPGQTVQTHAITVNVSKSPLEMVQSVVSSIQVPQSPQPLLITSATQSSPQISPQIIKHSPTGFPPGHILVSSGGQLLVASTNQSGVMAPPPPKIMTNQSGMPPISVSPMVTNVTASVSQVIPAVAQQVLGQQTVLVNALPAPFVLQPGVTMTMEGMTVGQNVQIPQLVTGNVIQQQIQIDNSDSRRTPALLSPETKKKGKKRKMSSQTVASMLHIAAQQNSGMVMSQQGFPPQIQMAHSPQGPVMQALTIVPSKNGGPAQLVVNNQGNLMTNANLGAQQLITGSQPAQQINLLQPVNLINSAAMSAGVLQNFPAIQQFIVPNLGGMVMNPDGTATILQDTSNLGMQLHIQNVNGQNVLTPVQNNSVFNGGQSILTAGPAGMVIRAPTSQGKIIQQQQQQQHSPGAAQFLSPNGGQFVVNGTQFSGQLSPLVASVSPSQQVTFGASPQQMRPNNGPSQQQDYIQMNGQLGQTLVMPCAPTAAPSSNQNTTYVQQNTTIVQQQTTMVQNNQQLQNFQQNGHQNAQNVARQATLNMDHQNYIISSNDNKQMQAVVVQQQQRQSPQDSVNYRQSVSTQTAVNQNTQSVTTNTFCQTSTISAGSPPDTTTLSPVASGGQSPPTVDTTTHSGSTDDGLSPAPSNYSVNCSDVNIQPRPQSCTMAMVHCVSSSEPDSADMQSCKNSDNNWKRQHSFTPKTDYADVTNSQGHYGKKTTPTHVAFAESSTLVSGLHYITEQIKSQDSAVSSRNYEKIMQHKRKTNNALVVMETHNQMHSMFDGDEEAAN